jgi:hypothetical protein
MVMQIGAEVQVNILNDHWLTDEQRLIRDARVKREMTSMLLQILEEKLAENYTIEKIDGFVPDIRLFRAKLEIVDLLRRERT